MSRHFLCKLMDCFLYDAFYMDLLHETVECKSLSSLPNTTNNKLNFCRSHPTEHTNYTGYTGVFLGKFEKMGLIVGNRWSKCERYRILDIIFKK